MANIRKTFNFRNGVQVDEDNFLVNPLGLVGIGTTVPTETLDVRGNLKVVGFATIDQLNSKFSEITGILTTKSLDAGGVFASAGIVTASSGVVTYFGDGGRLLNLPTSQWLDVDIGLGFTSIYAQGFVGVNTVSPFYSFQVGGTDQDRVFANVGASGVGIDSTGNIYATGIVTASSFVGSGENLTNLNGANITSGIIAEERLPIIPPPKIPDFFEVAGIITSLGGFVGNLTGHVIGNVIGIASTARSLTDDAVINILSIESLSGTFGITTSTNLLVTEQIGIGNQITESDLHISKTGISSIQLTGSTQSIITLGRSVDQSTNVGAIKFGDDSGLYPYSGPRSLDIINYDAGNLNFYLDLGSVGVSTGDFNWIYSGLVDPLMTLTYNGNLGIGDPTPQKRLVVNGSGEITSNLNVNENLIVSDDVTIGGNLVIGNSLVVEGTFDVDLDGINLNVESGISTVANIRVLETATINTSLGIGTNIPFSILHIFEGGDINENSTVISGGSIGIGTTALAPNIGLDASNVDVLARGLGIGTIFPRSYVDFSFAGKDLFGGAARFLLPPTVTSSERTLLTPEEGALIYNLTEKVHQGFNGITWDNLKSNWSRTGAGIHTTSNVGIGTTNPTSALTVKGNTSLETLNVSGVSTFSGNIRTNGSNIKLGDGNEGVGNQIKLGNGSGSLDSYGDSSDFWIYHNASTGKNLLQDLTGSGLNFWTNDFQVRSFDNTKSYIRTNTSGNNEVELYYDNSKKFETTGAGVTVTGTTFTNQLNVSGDSTFLGTSNFTELVGIGTTNPTDRLSVRGGDISVGISTAHGLILTSPNGTRYRLIVNNAGTLSTIEI
jgi:hypothetical protein